MNTLRAFDLGVAGGYVWGRRDAGDERAWALDAISFAECYRDRPQSSFLPIQDFYNEYIQNEGTNDE